jgi:hypothetical protein
MLFFPLFLVGSTLFTAAALPLPAYSSATSSQSSDIPSIPDSPNPPNVLFKDGTVAKANMDSTTEEILKHYDQVPVGHDYKKARLAYVTYRWRPGKRRSDDNKDWQHLTFTYHAGDTPDTPVIGKKVKICRLKPQKAPKLQFAPSVKKSHKGDIRKQVTADYRTLHSNYAKRIRKMVVEDGWHEGPGPRDETQVVHHGATRKRKASDDEPRPSFISEPRTIYRPITLAFGKGVPDEQVRSLDRGIRKNFKRIGDEYRPELKTANYGTVLAGWEGNAQRGPVAKHVRVGYFKVADKLTEGDKDKLAQHRTFLGIHPVRWREPVRPRVG